MVSVPSEQEHVETHSHKRVDYERSQLQIVEEGDFGILFLLVGCEVREVALEDEISCILEKVVRIKQQLYLSTIGCQADIGAGIARHEASEHVHCRAVDDVDLGLIFAVAPHVLAQVHVVEVLVITREVFEVCRPDLIEINGCRQSLVVLLQGGIEIF